MLWLITQSWPNVSDWAVSISFPRESRESTFSEVSIDKCVCNGPFCVWSMDLSLWFQSPAEWQTDVGPIMPACDRWPAGLNTDQLSILHTHTLSHTHIHTNTHIHTHTNTHTHTSSIIYYNSRHKSHVGKEDKESDICRFSVGVWSSTLISLAEDLIDYTHTCAVCLSAEVH